MENLGSNEQKAILRFVEDFCFPLLFDLAKPVPLVGTASLLDANANLYLVSAAHVMKTLKRNINRIGVPLGKTKASVWALGTLSFAIPREDEKFDIGVARIDLAPAVAKLRRSPWQSLTVGNLGKMSSGIDTFAFVGFPGELSDPGLGAVRSGRLLAISPIYRKRSIADLNRLIKVADQLYGTVTQPVDTRIDLVLEYPSAFLRSNGQRIGAFDLQLGGISGSPVWAILGGASLPPAQRLKLIGIVTEGMPGEYVRVKRWHLIAQAFNKIDPVAARELLARV